MFIDGVVDVVVIGVVVVEVELLASIAFAWHHQCGHSFLEFAEVVEPSDVVGIVCVEPIDVESEPFREVQVDCVRYECVRVIDIDVPLDVEFVSFHGVVVVGWLAES